MKTEQIRPKQILREIGRQWPNIWTQFKQMRSEKGIALPDWPEWCYIPIAAGVAIATQGGPINNQCFDSKYSPAVLTAAASWRVSQGVYRFDADLYHTLITQPLDGNIPCEALKRLPEWCVFIETINANFGDSPIAGFWSHLESDQNDGRMELRLVILYKDGRNLPVPIHLGDWTLEEGLLRMQTEAKKSTPPGVTLERFDITADIAPLLQLILYLCAENIDMPMKPAHPLSRATKSGRIDAPKKPNVWIVGERIGNTIRKYRNYEAQNTALTTTTQADHLSPRPHIRRAHWHHFWAGPLKGKRELILRWLAPIPVGVNEDDELPVVIHKVEL